VGQYALMYNNRYIMIQAMTFISVWLLRLLILLRGAVRYSFDRSLWNCPRASKAVPRARLISGR